MCHISFFLITIFVERGEMDGGISPLEADEDSVADVSIDLNEKGERERGISEEHPPPFDFL